LFREGGMREGGREGRRKEVRWRREIDGGWREGGREGTHRKRRSWRMGMPVLPLHSR